MATLETIHLSHIPSTMPIYAALYKNVTNAPWLREQLFQGNEEFEYAFIDADMILSRQHALAAVFRALNDYMNERLKSRNVHSEIVFALSSNNNIGEAFRRFGIGDATKNLLVFKVATQTSITAQDVSRHLNENVKGEMVPFSDEVLRSTVDITRLRKVHKVGEVQGTKSKKGTQDRDVSGSVRGSGNAFDEVEVQVVGLMALRGAT